MILVLGTMLAVCASLEADPASEGRAQKVASLYRQGVSALEEGDTGLAGQCFRQVLAMQPTHGNARYQLLSLDQRKPGLAAKVRQRKLTQIKIAKVDFNESTLGDAIEALNILIERETEGKFAANFVIQDPHDQLEKKTVTLKLGGVPASVVLDYVLKATGAKVRYDEHVIVISPVAAAPVKRDTDVDDKKKKPRTK